MKKLLFMLCFWALTANAAPVRDPDVYPQFKEDGTLELLNIVGEDTNAGVIEFSIHYAEVDLSVDVDGDFNNKAAIRSLARDKWRARISQIQAERTKKSDDETRRSKLNLGLTADRL